MIMPRVGIKLWLDFNQLPVKKQKRSFHVLLINKSRPIVTGDDIDLYKYRFIQMI